ncbi:MAG: aminoglycoside phosphotransferase family protein [Methylocella sp.]
MTALGEATSATERAAEKVIAAIPAWANATIAYRTATVPVISTMHRSVDSDGFAVDVDGAPFFLKITHPEARPWIDMACVFEAASSATAAGVAPAPRYYLPDLHAIVFERLDESWRTAMMSDLQNPDIIAAILTAKKRIHIGARFKRDWSIFDGITAVKAKLAGSGAELDSDIWWLCDAVADIEAAFRAAGTDSVPCHADGLASNIMIGPGNAIRLVDFDNSCNTDPLYELGSLLNEAFAFAEQMRPVIERYEGSVREVTLNRCRLYGIADDLYWGLWASLMNVTSERRGIEFLKYAKWRLLRCRMAVRDYDFERMLRTI